MLTFYKIGNAIAYQEVKPDEVLKFFFLKKLNMSSFFQMILLLFRLQGLGPEDRLIYQLIKQSDNNGINCFYFFFFFLRNK